MNGAEALEGLRRHHIRTRLNRHHIYHKLKRTEASIVEALQDRCVRCRTWLPAFAEAIVLTSYGRCPRRHISQLHCAECPF